MRNVIDPDRERTLTDEQYVKYSACPACRSWEIRKYGKTEEWSEAVFRDCECGKCGARWTEIFDVVGYTHLEVPDDNKKF